MKKLQTEQRVVVDDLSDDPTQQPSTRSKGSERGNGARRGKRGAAAIPWSFPKQSLEEAIVAAQAIEEKFAGKPTPASDFVKAVGYKLADDWRFTDLMKSAHMYGLLKWAGSTKDVEGTPLGSDIVTPSDPAQRQKALFQSFNNVELFKKVAEHYNGKKIPENEFFSNTLIRQFDVPRDRVPVFIKVFTENLGYVKAFAADKSGTETAPVISTSLSTQFNSSTTSGKSVSGDDAQAKSPRSFLDTCFILMPFGNWHDRYFKDIFIPATREAGFEPVRADGLFSTGSVMEQIWEQIRKAKVLLADLTDKNANVFYELGLAHADSKPVVLVTGNLEDVPFDLRHLRVVVYDQHEPNWGDKLKEGIATYLKAAKADPEKSIPQPFRIQPNQRKSD